MLNGLLLARGRRRGPRLRIRLIVGERQHTDNERSGGVRQTAYPSTVIRLQATKQRLRNCASRAICPAKSPRVTTPNRKVLRVVLGDLDQFLSNIKGPTPQHFQHRFLVNGQRLSGR
jgi:hypothetical protein